MPYIIPLVHQIGSKYATNTIGAPEKLSLFVHVSLKLKMG